jgi:hypothetical protein
MKSGNLNFQKPSGPTQACNRNALPYINVWGLGWRSGSGAALLVGRPRDLFPLVSLDFSVTYSFRPYHGPGVDSAPSENEYQELFLGVKAAGAWGWQPHHLYVPNVMEIWEPKSLGTLWATPGLLRDTFTLHKFMLYLSVACLWDIFNANKCEIRSFWKTETHTQFNVKCPSLSRLWIKIICRETLVKRPNIEMCGKLLNFSWSTATGRQTWYF